MRKKLVKTAKQQFEERLKELTFLTSYQGLKDERLYLCENDHKEMSILRDSEEWGFIEYKYQGSYQSMVDSEEFLYNIVCRFNEIGEPVKHIFDWYASADKNLTPFTVYDIWQCMEYLIQLAFEDLYEEVPDVRIIAAKEVDDELNDFKREIDALRKKMVEHIIQLCEQGMTLNVGSFLQNVYSITWVSGSCYACANIKDVYFRKNDEGKWEFSYESKSDAQGDSSDCFLDELTIETLQDIIASMQ